MRPIKFRGRDINGEFHYGDFEHGVKGGALIFEKISAYYVEVDEDSIAQLVGYDRNGREVYEGDTVISEYGDEVVARLMDNLPPKATLKEAVK